MIVECNPYLIGHIWADRIAELSDIGHLELVSSLGLPPTVCICRPLGAGICDGYRWFLYSIDRTNHFQTVGLSTRHFTLFGKYNSASSRTAPRIYVIFALIQSQSYIYAVCLGIALAYA